MNRRMLLAETKSGIRNNIVVGRRRLRRSFPISLKRVERRLIGLHEKKDRQSKV